MVDSPGGHQPALLDRLTCGRSPRCRRLTSLLLAAGMVLPMVGGLVFYVVLPIVDAFGDRAGAEIPKPHGLMPLDFRPYFPVDNASEWVLLVLLSLACFFNALVAGSTFLLFLRRRFQQCTLYKPRYRNGARGGLGEQLLDKPVSVVVPCYLPNEVEIIGETIDHILHNLRHDGALTLYVVYNTPHALQYEAELRARADSQAGVPAGRRLVVLHVQGSRSKAENLNAVFEQIEDEVTAIYDADHHPDPGSLAMLLRKLENHSCDCVQGSTYIRNTSAGLMSRVIDAEFFVTYFIYFISLQFIAGTGFFGGANAVWRTASLKGEKFSPLMQTEDIEFAARAILRNQRIRFCPEARSGELAPSSLAILSKQRLRWALGWEQVTISHIGAVRRARISCHRKFGLVYMLPMRWLLAFLSVVGAMVTPLLCYIYPPSIWPLAIDFLFTLGLLESSLLVCCTLLESIYHETPLQCIFVAAFMLASPLYLLIQVTLLLTSLSRMARGQTGGWVVTKRAAVSAQRLVASAPGDATGDAELPTTADVDAEAARGTIATLAARRTCMQGLERFYAHEFGDSREGLRLPTPALGNMRYTL